MNHFEKFFVFLVFFAIGFSMPFFQATGDITKIYKEVDEVVSVYRTLPLAYDREMIVKYKIISDDFTEGGTITIIDAIPKNYQVIKKNLAPGALFDDETHTLTWDIAIPPGQQEHVVSYTLELKENVRGSEGISVFRGIWMYQSREKEIDGDKKIRKGFITVLPKKFLNLFGAEF